MNIEMALLKSGSRAYKFYAISAVICVLTACQVFPEKSDVVLSGREVSPMKFPEPSIIGFKTLPKLESIVPDLQDKQAVIIGEIHNRYEHHLGQLSLIRELYKQNKQWVIGLEQFQTPYQKPLDDYIAGIIDERQMLLETEYASRWRFDYRLYKPILDFALENKIPLIALNVPNEIVRQVGKQGMESLTDEQKKLIPQSIDTEVPGYRERIEHAFSAHPGMNPSMIDNFISAQLLWDEGMAEVAANYLSEYPDKQMVILAGSGHVINGTGIAVRLERRLKSPVTTVIQVDRETSFVVGAADYILLADPIELPAIEVSGDLTLTELAE